MVLGKFVFSAWLFCSCVLFFVRDSLMVAWPDYVRSATEARRGMVRYLSNYFGCPCVHRVRRLGFVCMWAQDPGTQAAHRSRGLTCAGKRGMFRVPGGHPWTSCLTRSWRRLLHILHHTAKPSHRPERRRSPNTIRRKRKRCLLNSCTRSFRAFLILPTSLRWRPRLSVKSPSYGTAT
jgi:hypothetical protein